MHNKLNFLKTNSYYGIYLPTEQDYIRLRDFLNDCLNEIDYIDFDKVRSDMLFFFDDDIDGFCLEEMNDNNSDWQRNSVEEYIKSLQ